MVEEKLYIMMTSGKKNIISQITSLLCIFLKPLGKTSSGMQAVLGSPPAQG